MDLVLPRAHYLIRMNNGSIELQGEITDLQKSGEIGPISANDTFESEKRLDTNIRMEPKATETPIADSIPKSTKGTTPKKLVEAEAREVGRIRWSIYREYLKASLYVCYTLSCSYLLKFSIMMKPIQSLGGSAFGDSAYSRSRIHREVLDQGQYLFILKSSVTNAKIDMGRSIREGSFTVERRLPDIGYLQSSLVERPID